MAIKLRVSTGNIKVWFCVIKEFHFQGKPNHSSSSSTRYFGIPPGLLLNQRPKFSKCQTQIRKLGERKLSRKKTSSNQKGVISIFDMWPGKEPMEPLVSFALQNFPDCLNGYWKITAVLSFSWAMMSPFWKPICRLPVKRILVLGEKKSKEIIFSESWIQGRSHHTLVVGQWR